MKSITRTFYCSALFRFVEKYKVNVTNYNFTYNFLKFSEQVSYLEY